jgi:ATP sulfurylase
MGTTKTCPHDKGERLNPSGTLIRAVVTEKADIDHRIMRPEIAEVLKNEEEPFVTE